MRQLLIDTAGVLDVFPTVEHMFDFYPNGFKGMVIDVINYHVNNPKSTDETDQMFMDNIIDLYYASTKYHEVAYAPDDPAHEQYLTVALYMVNRTTSEFVRYHHQTLALCALDADSTQLGSSFEYILLKRK
jgi:hypothetical protein